MARPARRSRGNPRARQREAEANWAYVGNVKRDEENAPSETQDDDDGDTYWKKVDAFLDEYRDSKDSEKR